MEEHVGYVLIHSFCKVDSIPVHETGWVTASPQGSRGAAGRERIEVVGIAPRAATSLEFLCEAVSCRVLHDGPVSVVVVGVGDEGCGVPSS